MKVNSVWEPSTTYSTDGNETAHSYDVLTTSEDDETVFRVAGPTTCWTTISPAGSSTP